MKKSISIFVLLAALCGCAKNLGIDDSGRDAVVDGETVIGVVGETTTKTALSGASVVWKESDRVKVFSDSFTAGTDFKLKSGAGTASAQFTNNLGDGEDPVEVSGNTFYVGYPAGAFSFDGSTFSVSLPDNIDYVEGGFGTDVNPSFSTGASLTGGSFAMKNLCGVIKLSIKGTVKIMSVRMTLDKNIAGTATFGVPSADGIPALSVSEGTKAITMHCGGVQLNASTATDLYFVVPANSYEKINLYVLDDKGFPYNLSKDLSLTVNRSHIKPVATTLPSSEYGGSIDAMTEISFEDAKSNIIREEITVVSFNVKTQSDDAEASTEHKWSNRLLGVCAFFNENQYPIICTQECEYRQRVDILNGASGYAAYGLGSEGGKEQSTGSYTHYETVIGSITRPVSKSKNLDASNAIFYLTSKYTVLDKGTFWLVSGAPSSPDKLSDSKHHRCCSWIKFQSVKTEQCFYVFNTHLDNSTDVVRGQQLGYLWEGMNKVNTEGLPMALAGDFNMTTSGSSLESFKNNGYMLFARNVLGKTDKNRYPASHNCWSDDFSVGSNIDHIAFKDFYSIKSFDTDNAAYAGVAYISDHYPIIATAKLNPIEE